VCQSAHIPPLPAFTAIASQQDQLAACMSLYVEDQLSTHFRDLLDYIKKAEQQQKRSAIPEGQTIPGGWLIQVRGIQHRQAHSGSCN